MKVLYNSLFKRTSTYAIGIMFSAFFFERTFDVLSETIFESANKGVDSRYLFQNMPSEEYDIERVSVPTICEVNTN
ncbi:hypothetical protein GQX74_005958 [Glossina fuscipes]|nr:hypothetical protein GQX74_005958 [Glossina fuscipes]